MPSLGKNASFTSPSKVVDSFKKRTLGIFAKRKGARNSSLEASSSPIRQTAPLLASTPKPSPKKANEVSATKSRVQPQKQDFRLCQNAVVVLEANVVQDYFAKKKSKIEVGINQSGEKVSKSPKRRGSRKQATVKKPKRSPRKPRAQTTAKKRGKPLPPASTTSATLATTAAPAGILSATEEDENYAEIPTGVENNGHQQVIAYDTAATKIPSEVLETFGITSHQQGSASPCSTITQPLSPERFKTTPSPELLNENVPTPGSSNYYSTQESQATPTFLGNETVSGISPVLEVTRKASKSPAAPSAKSPSENESNASVTSHLDLHFELTHRLYESPKTLRLDELKLGSKDVRRLAPYSLKVAPDENSFFLYAAALTEAAGTYCCIVFDVIDHHMVAYSGHFLIPKSRLYDPILKLPVEDVRLTKLAECRHHLCLLSISNEKLLSVDGYFIKTRGPSYDMLQTKFLDAFLRSLDQAAFKERIRCESMREDSNDPLVHITSPSRKLLPVTEALEEPRTTQAFYETCLPITQERMNCLLKFVSAMGTVKKRHVELADTQVFCVLQTAFDTAYYAAHEDAGCTSFYSTAYLLGRIDDRFVVGIVSGQTFFIMATKRLFRRFDELAVGMRPIVPSNELFENIILPLSLPHEYSLVMLEVRQILQKPQKHQEHFKDLNQALGISGFQSKSLSNSFFCLTAATQPKSRRLHNAWLEQTLDGHLNSKICNAPCKFPIDPASTENPLKFCENMLKLWLQRLHREIHEIADSEPSIFEDPTNLSLQEFFTLNPVSYAAYFLPLFGLSDEHHFQCLTLDSKGEPSGVCHDALSASSVGRHVEDCHIRPLLWDDSDPMREISFTPFALVFRKRDNPPLSDSCDFNLLSWARSMVEKWPVKITTSYVKFIQSLSQNQKTINTSAEIVAPATPGEKQVAHKMSSPGLPLANKRKRLSDEAFDEESKRRCVASHVEEISE